jgi:L-asparaginase
MCLFVCTVSVFLTSFYGIASIFCKIIKINSKLRINRRTSPCKITSMQSQTTQKSRQIIVLGTGGTIAGKSSSATDNVDYVASEVGVEMLLAAIPSLADATGKASFADCELVCEQVAQVDSKDMTFEVWQRLLARCSHWLAQPQVQGIVITHGTDTLEETAFYLHSVMETTKPVVLTCAMRPSTAVAPDGPQNLLDALAVAAGDQIQSVVAVCASTIHSAVDVQKVHNYRLDAFSSGDAGPVGYVKEGKLVIYRKIEKNIPLAGVFIANDAINSIVNLTQLPRVEIVINHSGATGEIVQDLLSQREFSKSNKLAGLVVAATGNGTISQALERSLQAAEVAGVLVWRSSRCAFGTLVGKADTQFGDSGGLTPVKARIALMLQLAALSA